MGRNVEIDIVANDKTDRATRSATKNFEKLERETSKITKRMATNTIADGTKLGALFGESISDGLSKAAPAIAPVLVGVAIAAAPIIGATLSAAVIGGAGLGGVLGGVLLASRDTRVKAAATDLGTFVSNSLNSKAGVFVEPLLQSLQTFKETFNSILPNIGHILANASQFVKPLVSGVSTFVEKVTAGIDKLVAGAGPVIDSISNGVAGIGDAIGDVFSDLADNGVNAATALNIAFGSVILTIRVIGKAVEGLTAAFGVLAKFGVFGAEIQRQWTAADIAAKAAAQSTDQFAATAVHTAESADALAKAEEDAANKANALNDANRSLYSSQTSAAAAVAATTKSIKENGRTLDINTEKGRNNREALSNLASTLNAQYQATLKVNGAGSQANKVAESNRQSFLKLATQLTGSKKKAQELANQLLGIPDSVNTDINVNVKVHTSSTGRELLNAAGHRTGGYFSGNTYASSISGTHRTGGPEPVSPTVKNDVNVYIDGNPMRAQIRESQRNDKFRSTVGVRYAQ